MGQIVYILCALTSLGCTWLLIGRYRKSRVDLLFWSAIAFLLLTVTNVLLFIDLGDSGSGSGPEPVAQWQHTHWGAGAALRINQE